MPVDTGRAYEHADDRGLTLAIKSEITFNGGRVQSNFDDYDVLRINEAPRETRIYIVPHDFNTPLGGIENLGSPLSLPRSASTFRLRKEHNRPAPRSDITRRADRSPRERPPPGAECGKGGGTKARPCVGAGRHAHFAGRWQRQDACNRAALVSENKRERERERERERIRAPKTGEGTGRVTHREEQ